MLGITLPLPNRLRRLLLLSGLGAGLGLPARGAYVVGSPSAPGPSRALQFPRDHGSHPEQRIEWWYITGHNTTGNGALQRDFGFQLTFFRARVDNTQNMQSRFAARQLLFAHAAVTDVSGQRFWHDQRVARQGFDVTRADQQDTALRLRDWSLARQGNGYVARIAASGFSLDLAFTTTQSLLLQGSNGLSRKGPDRAQASYYYSQPQLAFAGDIQLGGQRFAIAGEGARKANAAYAPGPGAAWLDHEWSDGLMHPNAVGWDWIGMNLFDGSTLMAFQMRDKTGKVLWDGGSFRHPVFHRDNRPAIFGPGQVSFKTLRGWKSPLTQATYPVESAVQTPSGQFTVRALLDNQELDSRSSTGAVYWEGVCDLLDAQQRRVGRGYLEMTGYAKPLVL